MKKDTFNDIEKIKEEILKNFIYIDSLDDLPKITGGSGAESIYKNPKMTFHFLEYIFNCEYVDLDKKRGMIFVDDKTTWEFLLKTDCGYIRVYDWKGYSVSIGSVNCLGQEISSELKDKINYLKKVIEENVDNFINIRTTESKDVLKKNPLDNFMHALISLQILYNIALETNKKGFGYLESLILYVSLIDTLLRHAIHLTRINTRMSIKVDSDSIGLFYQENENFLSERSIFKLAKNEVDFLNHDKEAFFGKVNCLYNERNKAVHRYAITNFQYADIKEMLKTYSGLIDILNEIVIKLENKQAQLGVGFITHESLNIPEEEMKKEVCRIIETKINPAIFTKGMPKREPMFSDKYKGGITPKAKKIN